MASGKMSEKESIYSRINVILLLGLYLHFNCDYGIIPILRLFRPTVLVSGGCVFPQEASGDF